MAGAGRPRSRRGVLGGEVVGRGGAGCREVLERAPGVAAGAVAAQAVRADRFGAGGLDAGPGAEPGAEGRGLRLGAARGAPRAMLGQAEGAAPGVGGAPEAERAGGADGGRDADLDRAAAVAFGPHRPLGGDRAGRAGRAPGVPVDREVGQLEAVGGGVGRRPVEQPGPVLPDPHRPDHRQRVGPLLPVPLQEPPRPRPLGHRLGHRPAPLVLDQPPPEGAQARDVEPPIPRRQGQRILPVQPHPNRPRGLPIRPVLQGPADRHQRQHRRRHRRPPRRLVQRRERPVADEVRPLLPDHPIQVRLVQHLLSDRPDVRRHRAQVPLVQRHRRPLAPASSCGRPARRSQHTPVDNSNRNGTAALPAVHGARVSPRTAPG